MSKKIDPRLKFLQQGSRQTLAELETLDRFALSVEGVPNPKVKALVQFTGDAAALTGAGFQFHTTIGDIATGEIELDKLDGLAALPNVIKIEGSRPLYPQLDVSLPEIKGNLVHTGSPQYKGTGVIIGIIDSGIDYTHQSFRKADGKSRILAIWDQSLTPTGSESNPAGFTYGVEYTKADIDAALATASPFSKVRHQDTNGHGTHVSGIAAGDGSVAGNGQPAFTFVGVAPEADLIVVQNVLKNIKNLDIGNSVETLHAAEYIYKKAASLNKPVVINQSQGVSEGPHDGTSLLELGFDRLLGAPGRAMVTAGGNFGNDNIHAEGTVSAGGTERVQFSIQAGDSSPEVIDIWYHGPDRFGISIITPSGHFTGVVNPGATTKPPLNLPNGNRVFIDSTLDNPNNHDNQIQFILERGSGATIQQGTWSFNLHGFTVSDGRFDAWIERDVNVIAQFVSAHRNNAGTIAVPATSRETIAVASYVTKGAPGIGGISPTSSLGPSRDGRLKPEVAAPGRLIMSARSSSSSGSDQYQLMSGTSMAAPHVAGMIALAFQKNPKLTQRQLKDGLIRTARSDASTTAVPNNTWGGGKVDTKAFIDYAFPPEVSRNWVRIRPLLANWPSGPNPPTFEISADENGEAVIELAWDPQALLAPSDRNTPKLRYYSSEVNFGATMTNNDGSSRTVSVPKQTIRLSGNRASWTMPQALWDAYLQESLKSRRTPPTSTFRRNIYYRVRFQPVGASSAMAWPTDLLIQNNRKAPFLGMLPVSAAPSTQAIPDEAAVQAMGGIPLFAPNLWGDLLRLMWKNLPQTDPNRQGLERIFNHRVFKNELPDAATRGKVLELWLFAGPTAQPRLPQLLDRRVRVGNDQKPAIAQRDLKGTNTLVGHLLGLLSITPHPDLVGMTAPEQLLDDVITEILDPNGQVNQGRSGACNATAPQTLMIQVNPAEYARLQLGLLSASGAVQLANGANVTVPPAIFQVARYAGAQTSAFYIRTNAELVFQATMLKFAMGARFPTYDPTADPNAANGVNTVFQATLRGGLTSAEVDRALEGLFKVTFTTSARGPSQPIRDAFLNALGTARHPLVLALAWGGPATNPLTGVNAVVALRYDAGRIFFKNPSYAGSSPPAGAAPGGSLDNPPRRYEDPAAALESIGDADLRNWILWYHTPDQAIA